jgi:hypothetical protein
MPDAFVVLARLATPRRAFSRRALRQAVPFGRSTERAADRHAKISPAIGSDGMDADIDLDRKTMTIRKT